MSKGRDSALHSGVPELGIFGNTSMLGANLPVAAGIGLTFKMEQSDNVVLAYFGEGASNTGDFHEGLNFAGANGLPVVFVCENNFYAYLGARSRRRWQSRTWPIGRTGTASRASPSTATTCWRSTRRRRGPSGGRARAGDRRSIECKTYRWHGHSEHDKAFYRTDEELAMWRSRDPLPVFTKFLLRPERADRRDAAGDRAEGEGCHRRGR